MSRLAARQRTLDSSGFGLGWVSLANLMYRGALYGSVSRSGRSRCNSAERQESSAYRIQPIMPALNRIDLEFIHSHGPLLTFAVLDLFIFICVIYDTFKYRRLHPAYVWGGLPIVLGYPLTVHYLFSPIWQRMASWLVMGT